MSKLSLSFTLGKASAQHGGNVEHNNRKFFADNVDVKRIADNVTYVKQEIHEAYDELFSESLADYNAKQKRNDRIINDYYEHITNSKREESFYEIIVQFGDSKTAPVGSEHGEIAKKLLDEYIKGFKERNPNLYIFNAVLHMDEASPHLHIDVIPSYSKGRKNGLAKGVSMKSALIEQGFTPQSIKKNQLVAWEDSEREVMEKILKNHNIERDIKNANYNHQNVEEYKETQDIKKFSEFSRKKLSPEELTAENVKILKSENHQLKIEKEKLVAEKFSPYKSFYYSSPEKQAFVQSKLSDLEVPYRETDNGFEAQECYVGEIRKIEKSFTPTKNPHRDKLRENIDKFILQSKTFEEVLEKLKSAGYEIKHGKYLAVKPKFGNQFIRLKSLGEEYSEQALRNRIIHKQRYENDIDDKIHSAKNPDSIEVTLFKTMKQYTIVFTQDVLPIKKRNPKKVFSWKNDVELDKLSSLNKKISDGMTIDSLRKEFEHMTNSVSEKEKNISNLKSEIEFFNKMYSYGKLCFENSSKKNSEKEKALEFLNEHKITSENYHLVKNLIAENKTEINKLENVLIGEQAKLKTTSETLSAVEKISGGTYVQSLIENEKERRQADVVANGLKRVE